MINFDIFVCQGNHQNNQDNKHIHCPEVPSCPFIILSFSLFLPLYVYVPSQPLICFLSLEVSVHFLEFYINELRVYILFCMVSFTQHHYFEILPCYLYQEFISFYWLILYCFINIPQFIYPFTCWWICILLPVINKAAMNICV